MALFAIFGKVNHIYNLIRLKLRVNISDLSVFQSVKMKSVDFLNISEYVCLFDISVDELHILLQILFQDLSGAQLQRASAHQLLKIKTHNKKIIYSF